MTDITITRHQTAAWNISKQNADFVTTASSDKIILQVTQRRRLWRDFSYAYMYKDLPQTHFLTQLQIGHTAVNNLIFLQYRERLQRLKTFPQRLASFHCTVAIMWLIDCILGLLNTPIRECSEEEAERFKCLTHTIITEDWSYVVYS